MNYKKTPGNGIIAGTGTTISPITYCDVWNCTTLYSGCSSGTGCKSGDPALTDVPNGNFTPTSTTYAKPASDGGWMGYRTSSQAL